MIIGTEQSENYGPIQPSFNFEIDDGYNVLVGRNDSGKSALLQLIFKRLVNINEIGLNKVCIFLPERIFVDSTVEIGGDTLYQYNRRLYDQLTSAPLSYHGVTHDSQNAFKLIINNYNQRVQLVSVDKLLDKLGFSVVGLTRNQPIIDGMNVGRHGSGLRTLLPLIAALTDPSIEYLLIDEPELSLEPSIQKYVRDMFYEAGTNKKIIVTTHSHLFLNRKEFSKNHIVRKELGLVSTEALQEESQLYDLTFSLLGNNLSDLFFPDNFMIVEGSSDQKIIEKFLELKDIEKNRIKVFSATGIEKIDISKEAIIDTLKPLVTKDSPYKSKIVALVDLRNDQTKIKVEEMENELGDRFFELNVPSLEEYLPEQLYLRAGRVKSDDLANLALAKNNYTELVKIKREISNQIASVLKLEDLVSLPIINDAIRKAII